MMIGILQTGKTNEKLVGEYGDYPPMFEALFHRTDPSLTFRNWAVVDGDLPDDVHAADAWMITGSAFGVYDPEPWIEPLKTFLVDARAARVPLIGICFGHQIMAEAFGGQAEKSDRGWGAGAHSYSVVHRPGWMAGVADDFAMHAMHQDQVTALPDDAVLLAESPFCPAAMVAYGEAEAPEAISIQPHPEFARDYAEALIDLREDLVGPRVAAQARESFGTPVAADDFVRWVLDYLTAVGVRDRAA